MDIAERWLALAILSFVVLCLCLIPMVARAHDPAHSEQDEWYSQLKQPDNPLAPCCGKTDAYWCDEYHTKPGPDGDKSLYCTITDDRDIPGRPKLPSGTEVYIPAYKYKWDEGNPTGHSILFGSPMYNYGADGSQKIEGVNVYCFVLGGGV